MIDVARLFVGNKQKGSAWLITSQCAITAWHCLDSHVDEAVTLRWPDGSEDAVNSWIPCDDVDAVLLSLETQSTKSVLALSQRRLRAKDEGIAYGYSASSQPGRLQTLKVRCLSLNITIARFDLVTATQLNDLPGLSGGPILVNDEVVAINIVRGGMTEQIDALVLAALKRPPFLPACIPLGLLLPLTHDLALRVRNNKVWLNAAYKLSDTTLLTQKYSVENIVIDGIAEDFGELTPQLIRLLGFTPTFARHPTEPDWLQADAASDISEFTRSLTCHLDGVCFDQHLAKVFESGIVAGVPQVFGYAMQNCPALDRAALAFVDTAQKSLFLQRLVKARPEGNVQRLLQLTPRESNHCDAMLLLALVLLAVPALNKSAHERHNLLLDNYKGLFTTECFDSTKSMRVFFDYLLGEQIGFVILSHEQQAFTDVSLLGASGQSLMSTRKPLIIVRNRAMVDTFTEFPEFRAYFVSHLKVLTDSSHTLSPRGLF